MTTDIYEEREREQVSPLRGRLGRRHAAGGQPVHRRHRAARQRPGDAAELPGRDPRARGHARRRLRVPDPLRLARHPDAGRHAERAGRDEPGGARGQPGRARPRGATIIVNEDAFTKRNLEKAGYDVEPARRRLAERLPRAPDPDDHADDARGRGDRGRVDARRRPGQEPVRARRALVALRPPDRRHRALDRAEVRPQSGRRSQANLAAFNAGWSFGETTELLDVQYQVKPRDRRPARAPTATSTAPPRCRWG